MDEPLFGERKKQFSIAIGVYFGIKNNPRHFVLVATIILIFGSLALLVRWWRDQDDRIHPKFKYLIFLLAGCAILASIATNCYVWEKQVECNGLYSFQNKTCTPLSSSLNNCECGVLLDITKVPYVAMCNDNCPIPCPNDTSSGNKTEEEYYSIFDDVDF
ncbi:hypothetical protein DICPUDRAFT_35514 [Dictyostelium purpureum]|uniref:Uncharacterized protein n=1 Tax=Dictyostelium purpureum TaxID=5786 RepID=F0ZPE2_DICPU|nr:uncharacterized protein DICPUDRAFT_35514 [Dictyostelium purpureum]EGC34187.1 hypothetical protein DICPUDRAFT_35514 [Dictyostelium purpureum]|eukprot:XP_003289291.1 hypothetical protein DICPUDRAFT_35514 [Dictyostelium purpureum]